MKEKIIELLTLAIEANGLNSRYKEKTGDSPTVFFEFSGHVGAARVQIHKKGWEKDYNTSDVLDFVLYADAEHDFEFIKCKNALLEIIKNAPKPTKADEACETS